MKEHCQIGYNAIVTAEKKLKEVKVSFLSFAKQIALSHHEKWDGSGYPNGLSGDEIPLCARIMAVADVYDALISERVYKKGMPHEQAVEIIRKDSGTHFDPDVVDAFLVLEKEFRRVAEEYVN
jgi:putative two-component system response regulator